MTVIFWIAFLSLIGVLLALDLGVFHKEDSQPTIANSMVWTAVWIIISLLFSIFIYGAYNNHWLGMGLGANGEVLKSGSQAVMEYLTGYVVEKSLSMDNIFVIAMVFGFFQIPGKYQHRVLFWGIIGAVVLRAAMILVGTSLITKFSWLMYVFGAFLVFTAIKMLFSDDDNVDLESQRVVKWARKVFPLDTRLHDHAFFRRMEDGTLAMTPLFLALIVVENTDVLFALDSIPAIFAITTDPFLVFTSNIFAILGLRSMYFALQAMLDKFKLLKYSLVFILAYVGVKMLIMEVYHIPALFSLAVIIGSMTLGVLASYVQNKRA
ncbi:MAG: TerC family protein [Fibrobacter sp.]|nr:TerC family protein [Fibrobacter sp.]